MNNALRIEAYLIENGTLTYTFKGSSMNPLLIQGRDLFTVASKTSERCKKYDVVLYRRPLEQLVLHRIIGVREHDYVILGDNCVRKEYGIRDEDIIGVMISCNRKGKVIPVTDWRYRLYSYIWVAIHPCIILLNRIKYRLAQIVGGWLR